MSDLLLLKPERVFIDGHFEKGIDLLISNGRIEAVGRGIEAPNGCEAIDLSGKILLPALWDVHVHFFQTGIRMVAFDAGDIRDDDSLLSAMSDWLREHDEIDGFGYSPPSDGDLPSRTELDRISKTKPIFLRRIDGHSSCANSAALRLLEKAILCAEGARAEEGRLFGQANIEANRFFLEMVPEPNLREAARAVARRALEMGCGNIGALVPNTRWMRILLDTELPINIVPRLETLEPIEAAELGLSRVGGCLPMADGSFGSHSALLTEDYFDRPGDRGVAEISQIELDRWFAAAAKLHLSPAIHAIGDAAVDMVLRSIESVEGILRPRIEHAELLRDDQIARIAKMGISLAVQPVFEKIWGGPKRLYSRRLGERWRKTNRFRDLLDAGVTIAGSSDSYITPIDPLDGVITAVHRPNPAQRISLEEAFDMFTSNAARSEGLFNKRGSIAAGKSADFTIITSSNFEKRENITVEATIIDGKIVFAKGEL